MKHSFLVYLAGPIKGLTYGESCDWREYATKHFPEHIETLSPMRGKEFLKSVERISGAYDGNPLTTASGITCRDRFDIIRSDLILMNLAGSKGISIGSMIEIGWADAYRKPLVVVMEQGNVHTHPIVNSVAGFIVPSLDEAIQVATSVLG